MVEKPLLREHFPITQNRIYMNTGASGPCPREALSAMEQWHQFAAWEGPFSPQAVEKGERVLEKVRKYFASLLQTQPDQIVLTHNTTEGINIVLSSFPLRPEDEVLTTDLEHDSVLLPVFHGSRQGRFQHRLLRLQGGQSPLEALQENLGPRTRLFIVSHIAFCNGWGLPLKEMIQFCHSAGVSVLVDGAQSIGQIPINVEDLGADFYAVPGHKWLMGPDGTGALYLSSRWVKELQPLWVGWASHRGASLDGTYRLKPDARRFELATMDISVFAGLCAGIELMSTVGWEVLYHQILEKADLLRQYLSQMPGVELVTPPEEYRRTGLVAFNLKGVPSPKVVQELYTRHKIVVRSVGGCWPSVVRASVNFFQSVEEIERLVGALESIQRERA